MGHSVALHVNCLLYHSTMDTDLVICCRWKFIPGLFQDDHSPFGAPPTAPLWCPLRRSPIATLHRSLFAVLPLAFFLWRSPFAAKLQLLNGTRKQQKKKKKTEGGGGKGVELLCCVFVFAFKRQLVLRQDIQHHIQHLYSHQELARKGEEKRI